MKFNPGVSASRRNNRKASAVQTHSRAGDLGSICQLTLPSYRHTSLHHQAKGGSL